MAMTVGENGRAQKMERQVTGERSLMLRLIEFLIAGWLPLWAGKALNKPPEITIMPCCSLVSARNAGHAGSTIDLAIAHVRQIHHGTDGLLKSRSLAAFTDDFASFWTKI